LSLTIGSSERGVVHLRWAKEGVDDWNKAISLIGDASPRRSTSSLGETAVSKIDFGTCDSCARQFQYELLHNGFGDTAYAYCDRCGRTALLSCWYRDIPPAAHLKVHGPVNVEAELLLAPCECGGAFRATASPRCPNCYVALSAEAATSFIEANAPGTIEGWRWQRSWQGLYCVVIDNRRATDPWRIA
jgi:hypothetical protein